MRVRSIVAFLLLASLIAVQPRLPEARAQTGGTVCLVPVDFAGCLPNPSDLSGPITLPPSQLKVAVFLQNSSAMNGFNIVLKADHTVLQPVGADLSGSILPSPRVLLECISGVLEEGQACPATDTLDTIHISATSLGFLSSPPTSGLLFTALYNITGPSSGTTVGFLDGCAGTSVEGGVCVTVSNGTPSGEPVPETIQEARFFDMQDFALSSTPTSLSILPGSTDSSTVTLTSEAGYAGDVVLEAETSSPSLSASLNATLFHLTSDETISTALSTSSSATGTFSIIIVGTDGLGVSHSVRVDVTVSVSDFSVTVRPASVDTVPGVPTTATITVTGLRGSSAIHLSAVADSALSRVSLSSDTVSVTEGQTGSILLTLTGFSGTFEVLITASSGSVFHTASVDVSVLGCDGVSLSRVQGTLVLQPDSFVNTTVSVILACSPGSVNLEATVPAILGLAAHLSPSTLVDGGAFSTVTLTVSASMSTPPGDYIVFVQGTRQASSSNFLPVLVHVLPAQQLTVSQFFTDPDLQPLPVDPNGNPMVTVAISNGVIRSTSPGRVLAWVNVTNTGEKPLQSLKLVEMLPPDWETTPKSASARGSIHVYFASTAGLVSNLEITDPSTITVINSNPESLALAIPSLNNTAMGHSLNPGESILISVKIAYTLTGTPGAAQSYPINYIDEATAIMWTQSSYSGSDASSDQSAFFVAYAKSLGQ